MLGRWIYNWKRKYIRMVAVKVGVVQQYSVVAIAINPDTMYTFVRRIKKCPMYIALNDFN